MTERKFGIPVSGFVVDRFANVRSKDIPERIKAVGVDVDGTLRFYHHPWLNGTIQSALTEVAESRPTYIVANMYGQHEAYLSKMFKNVPLRGILTPSVVVTPGKKPGTARKPNPDMLQYIRDIEDVQPDEILMFGDQLSADIEAAARFGTESALVPRLGRLDHPGVRIVRRGPEALARAVLDMPVRARDFPSRLTPLSEWQAAKKSGRSRGEKTA